MPDTSTKRQRVRVYVVGLAIHHRYTTFLTPDTALIRRAPQIGLKSFTKLHFPDPIPTEYLGKTSKRTHHYNPTENPGKTDFPRRSHRLYRSRCVLRFCSRPHPVPGENDQNRGLGVMSGVSFLQDTEMVYSYILPTGSVTIYICK
jgi:hypothetical protein